VKILGTNRRLKNFQWKPHFPIYLSDYHKQELQRFNFNKKSFMQFIFPSVTLYLCFHIIKQFWKAIISKLMSSVPKYLF
jgi:hypothetical protein